MSRNTANARPGSHRATLYDEITNKIITELEAGRVPGVQPWGAAGRGDRGRLPGAKLADLPAGPCPS